MDLLSPAESKAFQSFLSSMDYTDSLPAPEWSMYAGAPPPADIEVPHASGKEALAKATKDLMALDADRWDTRAPHQQQQMQSVYDSYGHFQQQYDELERQSQGSFAHHHHHQQQQQRHDSFPFLQAKQQQQILLPPYPQQQQRPAQLHHSPHQHSHIPQHLPLSLLHTNPSDNNNKASSDTTSSSSTSSLLTPTSPHNAHGHFSFPPQQQQEMNGNNSNSNNKNHNHYQHQQMQPPPSSAPPQVHIRPPSPRVAKRPSDPGPTGRASGTSHKRARPSPPSSAARSISSPSLLNSRSQQLQQSSSISNSQSKPSLSQSQPQAQQKHQTLLSPSQKKANHIQSEQKRRANIRRGYEALCETVPALREAIREEEEKEAEARARVGVAEKGGKGKKRKKGGKGEGKGGDGVKGEQGGRGEEKERVDGRAGPRSENVVLSKTIEYITTLLAERSALLARLHRARSSLPPGHSSLMPQQEPLWEREWKGGQGRLEDEDGEEGGEEGGEEEEGSE